VCTLSPYPPLAESVSVPLRYEGMAVYFIALTGFLAFYGPRAVRAAAPRAGLFPAFISGAIIMNSALMELATEKGGWILPFMTSGIIYA
jgi:hypothetical protein